MVRFNALQTSESLELQRAAGVLMRLTGHHELLLEWSGVMTVLTDHMAHHLSGLALDRRREGAAAPVASGGASDAPDETQNDLAAAEAASLTSVASSSQSLESTGSSAQPPGVGGDGTPGVTAATTTVARASTAADHPSHQPASNDAPSFPRRAEQRTAHATADHGRPAGDRRSKYDSTSSLAVSSASLRPSDLSAPPFGGDIRRTSVRVKNFFQRMAGVDVNAVRLDLAGVLAATEVPLDERTAERRRATVHNHFCDLGPVLTAAKDNITAMWSNFLCETRRLWSRPPCTGARSVSFSR